MTKKLVGFLALALSLSCYSAEDDFQVGIHGVPFQAMAQILERLPRVDHDNFLDDEPKEEVQHNVGDGRLFFRNDEGRPSDSKPPRFYRVELRKKHDEKDKEGLDLGLIETRWLQDYARICGGKNGRPFIIRLGNGLYAPGIFVHLTADLTRANKTRYYASFEIHQLVLKGEEKVPQIDPRLIDIPLESLREDVFPGHDAFLKLPESVNQNYFLDPEEGEIISVLVAGFNDEGNTAFAIARRQLTKASDQVIREIPSAILRMTHSEVGKEIRSLERKEGEPDWFAKMKETLTDRPKGNLSRRFARLRHRVNAHLHPEACQKQVQVVTQKEAVPLNNP